MPESPTAARCVVRRDDELLVEERVDPDHGRVYLPPGREVGDGDPVTAVRQEFSDLLGVTLTDLDVLGTYDGTRVYEGNVEEAWLSTEEGYTLYDPETGETERVCWLHVDDFRKYGETLRPEGLLDALGSARDVPADA